MRRHPVAASATLHVAEVNDAPVADDSVSFTMAEDGTLLIEEAALLGSSSDPDNEDLHVVNLELGEGASGTLTPNDAAAPEGHSDVDVYRITRL